jgi:hypothetical protein
MKIEIYFQNPKEKKIIERRPQWDEDQKQKVIN